MPKLDMPAVIEKTDKGEKTFDLYARLVKDRIVFLDEEIDRELASSIIAQLLYLDNLESDQDIKLYINSPGGSCYSAYAIVDTMQLLKHDVQVIVFGYACSAAAIIATAGTKGKRHMLPSARIMVHEPSSGTYGKLTDMQIDIKEAEWAKKKELEFLNKFAPNSEGWTEENIARDKWFGAEEAIAANLIDKVVTK